MTMLSAPSPSTWISVPRTDSGLLIAAAILVVHPHGVEHHLFVREVRFADDSVSRTVRVEEHQPYLQFPDLEIGRDLGHGARPFLRQSDRRSDRNCIA